MATGYLSGQGRGGVRFVAVPGAVTGDGGRGVNGAAYRGENAYSQTVQVRAFAENISRSAADTALNKPGLSSYEDGAITAITRAHGCLDVSVAGRPRFSCR